MHFAVRNTARLVSVQHPLAANHQDQTIAQIKDTKQAC